jgi:hypothetical protein
MKREQCYFRISKRFTGLVKVDDVGREQTMGNLHVTNKCTIHLVLTVLEVHSYHNIVIVCGDLIYSQLN